MSSSIDKARKFILEHQNIRSIYLAARGISNAVLRNNPLQRWSHRVQTLEYLNVGCDKNTFSHTINLDYRWLPGVDLTADIQNRLPIADGRLKGIFCEHVLEHIPLERAAFFLAECMRIMKPGGILRIIVPDAELYLAIYSRIKNGERTNFPFHDNELTPMMQVNTVFRSYNHQYAYDFETLEHLLREAGFIGTRRVEFRTGMNPSLLLDSEDRRPESLAVETMRGE